MATYENIQTLTATAGADLSGSQYLLVAKNSTADQVVVAGDGANAIGVLLGGGTSGQAVTVGFAGKLKAIAGGTVAAGARVASDAAGKVVTAATGDYVLGTAITGGAADAVIEILFDKNGIEPA
jgi:hypothetical protein